MLTAAALTALVVQGCTKADPPPATSGARIFSHDMEGKAAFCAVPANMTPLAGKENPAGMTTGGNGWCGIPVRGLNGAFTAGLLTAAPHNGKVYVHTVGDDTRIDYVAKLGPVVPDSFAVRLIPGDAVVKVAVTPAPTIAAAPAPGK